MPPSFDEWLPSRLLARFVVEAIDDLDLTVMRSALPPSPPAHMPHAAHGKTQGKGFFARLFGR